MKTCVLAVLIALAGASVAAAATQVQHLKLRDQFVSAYWENFDSSGCPQGVVTSVTVNGGFGVTRDGSTTASSLASVAINVFDYCSGTLLLFAEGVTPNQTLQIDPNLGSAHLHTVVPLWDETHNLTIYATVEVSWQGLAKPTRTNDHGMFRSGELSIVANSKGTIRDAQATGTVTLSPCETCPPGNACVTCLPGNYVPLPSKSALIAKDAYGEVTITRERGQGPSGKQRQSVN